MKRFLQAAVPALAAWLASAPAAWACSVCQGNKDSELVKGAESGVLVMVIITYTVVLGFVGMAAACFVRARALRRSREKSER